MKDIKIVKLSEAPLEKVPAGAQPRSRTTLLNEAIGGVGLRVVIGECVPGVDSGEHVREYDEVLYYIGGEPTVEVTGGKTYTFAPDTLIVVPAGLKHRHLNRGKDLVRQLFIQVSSTKQVLDPL